MCMGGSKWWLDGHVLQCVGQCVGQSWLVEAVFHNVLFNVVQTLCDTFESVVQTCWAMLPVFDNVLFKVLFKPPV